MLLDIRDITAGYGNLMVLRNISFSLTQGETLAVIGPNGAGKTTLLWAISGLIRPKSGHVFFDGEDITGWECSRTLNFGIGHVLEGNRVFSRLSTEDNLLLGAYACKAKPTNLTAVYQYFPELKARRHQLAGSLSGGEKQMLAIARTLMCKLKLMLLDEPSAGLAPLLVKRLFEILANLRDAFDLTILLVEQEAEKALEFSNSALVLAQGCMMLKGEAHEMIHDPDVKRIYLGEGNI